jgi:dGTPase
LLLPLCQSATLADRLKKDYTDEDAKVGLLRARAINTLTQACAKIFLDNQDALLKGEFDKALTDALEEPLLSAWKDIEKISVEKIYNYSSVVQIEVAGYKVMGGLLEEFVPALIENSSKYHKKLVALIPKQFISQDEGLYSKIQSVLDFVSGMTDLYAVELFKHIKGIEFPAIR